MTENRDLVIVIHGIRDIARWQAAIAATLEEAGFQVELTNYGRMNIFQFLLPFSYFRQKAVETVTTQIRHAAHLHPGANISFIAHSFGTYILVDIIARSFDLKINRIVLCGSVVRYHFPFEQLSNRFKAPVLNEVGTADPWPAVAESVTTGYGAAGTFGFRRPGVKDRFHNDQGHGYFLTSEFCRKYWLPFFENGTIVPGDLPAKPPAFWVRALSVLKLKTALLGGIVIAAAVLWTPRWLPQVSEFVATRSQPSNFQEVVDKMASVQAIPAAPPTTRCDQLASIEYDGESASASLSWDAFRADLALAECSSAISSYGYHPRLVTQLARAAEKRGDCKSAMSLYDFALKHRYAAAAMQIGYIYKEKQCGFDEIEKALEKFQVATALGNVESYFEIGLLYEYGIGIDSDVRKACEYFETAAGLGSRRGMRNLARCLDDGGLNDTLGKFTKEPKLAGCWNFLAYSLGHPTSATDLLEGNDKWTYDYRWTVAEIATDFDPHGVSVSDDKIEPRFNDEILASLKVAKDLPLNNDLMLQGYVQMCEGNFDVTMKVDPKFLDNYRKFSR